LPTARGSLTIGVVTELLADLRRTAARHRTVRAARSRANRRIAFLGHALVFGLVVLLLAVTAGLFVALVVALSWGVFLGVHGFFWVVAPGLRRKWVEAEVGTRVHDAVTEERRLVSGEHTKNLEETTAQLAHEIRNPITAARSLVQQIAEDPSSADAAEYARVAVEELDRVERSIAHLLRFAREEPVELKATSLCDAVESGLGTLADRVRQHGIVVDSDLEGTGRLLADPDKLRRITVNLVANALEAHVEASSSDPRIWVSAGESLDGRHLCLRVKDNGPGIEADRLEKIFTPFYTSKRDGTGLGLAITKKLVDAHGGNIEVHSKLGGGTEFVVSFPKLGAEP
jgi:signal transduction histidine kinase